MKVKHIVSILCLLIAAAMIFAGCGAEQEPLAGSVPGQPGGEEQSSESSQASAGHPTADGNPRSVKDLYVEYPDFMIEINNNGALDVCNFCTETGTALYICAGDLGDNFEIDAYIANSLLAGNAANGGLEDMVINGRTWRASDSGRRLYLAAANDDGVYEVILTRGASEQEYADMYDLVMKTLWIG
ncbi:MAG: hypothetical protein IKZ81_06685 [Clostridia bacterium]|nr:hypothetical protein [Clostridia bacterium]